MLIVQIFEHLFTGDGYHRFDRPARALGQQSEVMMVDCHHQHSRLYELLELADVVVTSHFTHIRLFDLIEQRRRLGKVTVFETADDYRNPQPWNPIAAQISDPQIMQEHSRYVACADAVQTSSNQLTEIWRPLARRIITFENQIAELKPLPDARTGKLTIGWAGSQGHLADWFEATRYLQPWFDSHPEIQVSVMCHELGFEFLQLPADRYRCVPCGIMQDYLDFLSGIDIGLAPLLPIEWNRTRSDVKFIEYASAGVAGVYSNLEPYQDSVKNEKTGLLVSNPQEMVQALERLVSDSEFRLQLRRNAYEYVSQGRQLHQHIGKRIDFYRSLLPADFVATKLPADFLSIGIREGNYLQLPIDGAGKIYQNITEKPLQPESLANLQTLIQRCPTFIPAQLSYSRILCSQKQYLQAIQVLQQAIVRQPYSLEYQCEMGRCYAQGNDLLTARQILKDLLKKDPFHVRAWHYLLSILSGNPSDEMLEQLTLLDQYHPLNYHLQLKTISLLPAQDQGARFILLLQRLKEGLSAQHLVYATPSISRVLQHWSQTRIADPMTLAVLKMAGEIFPDSAAIAAQIGMAYRAIGEHQRSSEELRRAANLYKITQLCSSESNPSFSLHYLGLISQQIASIKFD